MTVTLITSDNVAIAISSELVEQYKTIMNMVGDSDDSDDLMDMEIPLPSSTGQGANIDSTTMNMVIEFTNYHIAEPFEIRYGTPLPPWVVTFCDRAGEDMMYNLMKAANHFDYELLLKTTARVISGYFKGKTPAEIREKYGIVNDFTDEEEAEILKQTAWMRKD